MDNAKVSLCVEGLVRLLEREVGLVWGRALEEAVEKGVRAREERAKGGGRKKEGGEEGWRWLRGSAGRIRGVVEMAKMARD